MGLRVALLGQYPLDEQKLLGGPEAVVVPLLRALAGHEDLELHVAMCLPGARERMARTGSGHPLHVLPRRRFGRLTFHWHERTSLRRELGRIAPDVVHAQGMGIYADAAVSFAAPHLVTAHGVFFREARFSLGLSGAARGLLDSAYERYCAKRVQNLVAISPYVEEELSAFAAFPRVYHIENPVDDRYFDAPRTEQEPATILYAGRVIRRKGLSDLVRAVATLRRKHPAVRLRVAGETDSDRAYVCECRSLIEEQGLGRSVDFLGQLTVEAMVEELGRCTLMALPSYQETAPVVIAEAMAAGRAVVASRICGIPYMVEEGSTGLLCDPGDLAGLVRALERLLAQVTTREAMGTAARAQAEQRFRAAAVAEQTRQAYFDVARSR